MADNKVIKTIVKKRYSIRDNAINKSVMNSSIDLNTGKRKDDNVEIDIEKVGTQDISDSLLNECVNNIVSSLNKIDFYKDLREPSFEGCEVKELEIGFNIIKKALNQAKQRNRVWFDYDVIVNSYKKEYKFDAYILGVYYGLRAYTIEHILILNKIFKLLKEQDITKFESFVDYCKDLKFIKDDNGELEVDEDRYQRGLNDMLFGTHLLDEE